MSDIELKRLQEEREKDKLHIKKLHNQLNQLKVKLQAQEEKAVLYEEMVESPSRLKEKRDLYREVSQLYKILLNNVKHMIEGGEYEIEKKINDFYSNK